MPPMPPRLPLLRSVSMSWRPRNAGSLSVVFLLLALVLSGASGASAQTKAKAKRAVIVSWDGAANWVVTRLLAEGKLPNVARLAASGVQADYNTPAYPSKTACGHAALWTGAYADINGVSGNSVSPPAPRGAHPRRGRFRLFVVGAAGGAALCHGSQGRKKSACPVGYPELPARSLGAEAGDAKVPKDRFVTFDGFESGITAEKIWDGSRP